MNAAILDTPKAVVKFWRAHVASAPWFNADKECLVVFLLNTRRRVMSFEMLSHGTKDTVLVNRAETFRLAVARNASAIIIAHNHPSGDTSPSLEDIKVTRDLLRAGALINICLLDSVIIGSSLESGTNCYTSFRELGYFPADCATGVEQSAPTARAALGKAATKESRGELGARVGQREKSTGRAAPSVQEPPKEFSTGEFQSAVQQSVALLELLEHRIIYDEGGRVSDEFSGDLHCGIVELVTATQRRLMAVQDDYFESRKLERSGQRMAL